jgi:hypothetical protein
MNMRNEYENIVKAFEGQINLLLVDGDKKYLDFLESIFTSPLFNIKKVTSLKPALSTIQKSNSFWHCWVVDVALGEDNEGLMLLREYREFPFTIVWSGLGSMTVASEAIHLGAMNVFDKKLKYIDLFFREVCKVAALGYILRGKNSQYLPYFLHLKETRFHNRELWAEQACVSIRQLERICSSHSSFTTRYLLSLYYSLCYLLLQGSNGATLQEDHRRRRYLSEDFFGPHIEFVDRKLSKFQQTLAA